MDVLKFRILVVQCALDFLTQYRRIKQILDAQADAVHFVRIRRADTAAGGANLALAEQAFVRRV